jgi:signal transduction histidine kinase
MGKLDESAQTVTRKRGKVREASTPALPPNYITDDADPSPDGKAREAAEVDPDPKGKSSRQSTSRRRPDRAATTFQAELLPAPPPIVQAGPRRSLPVRRHSAASRTRGREGNIAGLVERNRLALEHRSVLPLPDPLFVLLPGLRQLLLNSKLDDTAGILTDSLAGALAPAFAELWIADPTPWSSERDKVGGQELTPVLRLRARSRAVTRVVASVGGAAAAGGMADLHQTAEESALITEVATTRRPQVLFDTDLHPLAGEWPELSGLFSSVGTVAAYPLETRGQFLGILAVGATAKFSPRHLAAFEELRDLAALAADRDRLLSYSRSQEALAQTVVRQAPVAIAVLASDEYTFALSNPPFATLLGLDQKVTLVGQRLDDLLPPDRANSVAASLRLDAVYRTGEPQAMIELPIHHRERGMTYWNVTSAPLPRVSASSGVGGVLVAAVDVTRQVVSRHRAQESAEMAQDRIGQMMTLHATSLAVASQLGADPRELLADILRRSIALLGARAGAVYVLDPRYDELEVVVCQGLRGDYAGARIRVGEGLAGRVGQTGKGLIIDDYRAYPFRTAIYDGEDFSAVIAVPLIHRGQVVGVLDVLDDAERRAFTDDDLWLLDLFAAQAAQAIENARTYVELERAYRKQRELDRMKDDFIATASHELRTPLTGVSGFLDLLLEYPGSRDEPLAQEFLQKASESAEELAEIAERLLQTSRLDTGSIEMHIGPVRLATVVDEVLRSYRSLPQVQGGRYDLTSEVPPHVYVAADLGRLKEVLDNLISNAIKYSPHGGRIALTCLPSRLRSLTEGSEPQHTAGLPTSTAIDERPTLVMPQLATGVAGEDESPSVPSPAVIAAAVEGRYVVVEVRDQGMGIPSGERGNLFRRFSRLESARASQIRGTGLGLYLCRQIMRGMEGDVWLLESVPGQGTAFAFALPTAESFSVGASGQESGGMPATSTGLA